MGVRFLLFLRPKYGYLLQNLPANVFYDLLEGKIVENKDFKKKKKIKRGGTSNRDLRVLKKPKFYKFSLMDQMSTCHI